MAFTESTIIDLIEVVENGTLQIRQANIVQKDGVEIARTFHRSMLSPGTATDGQDPRVIAVASAVWTPEVIAAAKAVADAEAARVAAEQAALAAKKAPGS